MTFIPVAEPLIGEKEKEYVMDCLDSGWISSKGKYVEQFEKAFSKYCNCKCGVSTSNGTTALHLALTAIGIKPGDEVIVPDLTFIATANTVRHCFAEPVFVDSEPETWNIDPNKIREKITEKTRAIIPVHLYGHPVDMDPILEIAEEKNLIVIEDGAEAHGALYKNKKVGSIGDLACFSFYGNKIITTGEGGMITTSNEELAETLRELKDHGMSRQKRYWHPNVGFNYRMTNIQAAIGLAQLEKIDDFISIKRKNTKFYNSLLENTTGIGPPPEAEWAKNVYWMYTILVQDDFKISRDELMKKLGEHGVDTRPVFYPMHKQPPYIDELSDFKVAEKISRMGMNLPSSVTLSEEQINCIIEYIKGV